MEFELQIRQPGVPEQKAERMDKFHQLAGQSSKILAPYSPRSRVGDPRQLTLRHARART